MNKIVLGILMVFVFGAVNVMGLTMSYPVFGIIEYANGSHPASVSIILTDTRTFEIIDLSSYGSAYDPVDGLFLLDMAQLPSGYEDGDGIQVEIDDGKGYTATVIGKVNTSELGTEMGTITLTSVGNILINEFQPNPEGTDAGNEWVELYNNGTTEVNLTGWTLETLSLSGVIQSKGFKQFIFPSLTLTNTGDIIVLKYGNITIDRIVYGDVTGETSVVAAPGSGQSAGRIPDGGSNWAIFTTPTPGASNSGGACTIKGDEDCDGVVSDFELLDYINKWAQGLVGDFDLLEVIDNWAKG